ncbi:phage protease [Tepidicella xavieri]|uniref:Phage I-like protein n=1 Tax=Tepidicella xavieri TaxID=360241 RepID=A0A4R6U3J8_9BURK|nr:phage protease [Tepidicella xavieri]TDQ40970.1 phage I-like protein [Tepidicella xavieri]
MQTPRTSPAHPAAELSAGGALMSIHASSPSVAADAPPEWVELIPAGDFSGRDGRGPYRLDAEAVLKAFAAGGIDLPIDYEHQSLEAEAKAGPVPAAGWIKELEVRDGALWARVQWTPRAAELIAAREYRFLSPVFRHKQGRVVALAGAGLVHYPNLDLNPVANRQGDAMSDPIDLAPIAEALGAPADADAAQLVAHAASLRRRADSPDPAEWVPMSQHKAVADELARLQAEVARQKAEAAVSEAMRAGKLAPALKDWAMGYASHDPEGFAAWAAAAPVIVSAQSDAHAAKTPEVLTEEERYVCAQLGLTEDDFIAHKRKLESLNKE